MDTFKRRRGGFLGSVTLLAALASTPALAQEAPSSTAPSPSSPAPSRDPDFTAPSAPSSPDRKPTSPEPSTAPRGIDPTGTSPANGKWGSFKNDSCTGLGLRQKSAILWDIKGDWEQTCYVTGATINGYTFAHPARCVNTGTSMWGEFDVPDKDCMPYWGSFKSDSCKGVGIRQHSAILWNIKDQKWEDACWQMPGFINGVQFEHPSRCRTTTFGIWGEFDVPDRGCGPISPP